MADDEEVVVTIADETGTQTEGGADDPVEALKAQYAELQKKDEEGEVRLEAEKRRADDATRAAETERRRADEATTTATEREGETVASRLQSAKAEADSAETEYATAMEKGDFSAAAKAQRKMAASEALIQRLDEASSDLEARKTAPKPARIEAPADGFEAHVSKFTQPTADWMRSHRDWVTDPVKSAKLQRAHNHALGEGLDPDTPEYFEHVETRIGLRQAAGSQSNGAQNGAAKPVRRAAAPPVAPVNGGGGNGSSGSRSSAPEVTLRSNEVRSANDGTIVWGAHDLAAGRIKDKSQIGKPIGNQEMARRKHVMAKDGHYDRTRQVG